MVRHDYEGVQFITPELVALHRARARTNHFRVIAGCPQEDRSAGRTWSSNRSMATKACPDVRLIVRKGSAHPKASAQPERYEQSLANDVPMREAPVVPAHVRFSELPGGIDLLRRVCNQLAPGGSPAKDEKPGPTKC